jgi:CrcB protein
MTTGIAPSLGLVALGALVGGPARLFVSSVIGKLAGERFPWGTLTVNVLGCLAIGAAAAIVKSDSPYWLLLVTGGLGSFTTVSSFAAQSHALLREDVFGRAAAYIGSSLILGLGAAALGYGLAAQ